MDDNNISSENNSAPQAPETPNTSVAQENKSGSLLKSTKFRLIALLGAAVIIVMLLFVVFQRDTPIPQQSDKGLVEITKEVRDGNKERAETIANYMLTQKRPDGYNNFIAHLEEICADEPAGECRLDSKNYYEINNSWSALGFYSAWKVTQRPEYLAQAEADLQKLIEFCSTTLDDCLWVLAQPTIIALDSEDSSYNNFLSSAAERLLTESFGRNVMLLGTEARQLALLYTLFQDERYLEEAKVRYTQAKERYLKGVEDPLQNRDSNPLQVCWVTLAAAEIARAGKDHSYTTEAILLHTDPYIKEQRYNNPFTVNIQPCVETYRILYSLTNDNAYMDEGLRMMRHLEDNFHDTTENLLIWGDGGILAANPESADEFLRKQVNITDTSYMLYLLYIYNPNEIY